MVLILYPQNNLMSFIACWGFKARSLECKGDIPYTLHRLKMELDGVGKGQPVQMVNLSECVKQQTDRRGSVLHSSTPICSSSSSHSEEEVQKSREQWANMSNSLLFYSSSLPPFFPIQGVEGVEAGALPGKDGYYLVLHHEEQTVWVTLKKFTLNFLSPLHKRLLQNLITDVHTDLEMSSGCSPRIHQFFLLLIATLSQFQFLSYCSIQSHWHMA